MRLRTIEGQPGTLQIYVTSQVCHQFIFISYFLKYKMMYKM